MIIITSNDTIDVNGQDYKIVRSETFNPAYPDFEPRVLDNCDPGTGGLIVEFGHNRLTNVSGEIEQIVVHSCDRYILAPIKD